MNIKRMILSLIIAGIFGVFCAYGTSTVEIPGFDITMPYLLTVFYSRLMIGLVIGLAENIQLLKKELLNSILRGAIFGAIVSVSISFYGGGAIFMAAGIIYGLLTDFIATKLS
ncbi:MAG: hypothetical protein GYA51_06745 [Candidatus Methanofastidiosa archaeon]|nr:hypothetical protein [Candidatus Methanofastidiosa archaeon]